jgi:hypothetical protein
MAVVMDDDGVEVRRRGQGGCRCNNQIKAMATATPAEGKETSCLPVINESRFSSFLCEKKLKKNPFMS